MSAFSFSVRTVRFISALRYSWRKSSIVSRPGVSIIWLPKWSRSSAGSSWRTTLQIRHTMNASSARLFRSVSSLISIPTWGMNSLHR